VNFLRDNHTCVKNTMMQDCPICDEFLFESLKLTAVLKCGHTMHFECLEKMVNRGITTCPICSKSLEEISW
jgi:RING finger/CHY zinc finger protein 1